MLSLSSSMTLGLAPRSGGGGTPTPTPTPGMIPIGTTFALAGDGTAAFLGDQSIVWQLQKRLNMRAQPCAYPQVAKSGTSISNAAATLNAAFIVPYAIDALKAMVPGIVILGPYGSNDNVLSEDPATSQRIVEWEASLDYTIVDFGVGAPKEAEAIIVVTPVPSAKAGEATHRTSAIARMQAKVDALIAAGHTNVHFVSLAAYDPLTLNNITSDASRVHPNAQGAAWIADAIFAVLDPLLEAATPEAVLDMIFAGTYPLMSGGELTTADRDLPGNKFTGLTAATTAGGIPTTKSFANTSGGTATVEKAILSGTRNKMVATLTGGDFANGRLFVSDTSNTSLAAATPGKHIMAGALVNAPAGYHSSGVTYGTFSSGGGGAFTLPDVSADSGAQSVDRTSIWNTATGPVNGVANSNTGRGVALFYRTEPTAGPEFSNFFAYLLNEMESGQTPAYLGEIADSAGAKIVTANWRLKPTITTFSQAAGGTVRVDPGLWFPRGMGNAEFKERRIYRGTVSDTAVGSGTQMGTSMTGTTWTQVFGAAAGNTGERIYVEVDVQIAGGPVITARSVTTFTIT